MQATSTNGPVHDFIHYISHVRNIDTVNSEALIRISSFLAAVLKYAASPVVFSLRAAGVFSWSDAQHAIPGISEEELLDHVRVTAYRTNLPATDRRRVSVDRETLYTKFPSLLSSTHSAGSAPFASQIASAPNSGCSDFAPNYSLADKGFVQVRAADESGYINYWIEHSETKISAWLSDSRVVAGLDAIGHHLLSFHGFLEKVYGEDYEKRLRSVGYAPFPGLPSEFPGLLPQIITRIAAEFQSGKRRVPPGLREQYPDLYIFYSAGTLRPEPKRPLLSLTSLPISVRGVENLYTATH
jgi:hypothetical protein